MNDRALELDDIQGNILGGFNTDIQEHIFLKADADKHALVAAWLASIADQVTVASEVRAKRLIMKAGSSTAPAWLFVAISQGFLKAIAPDVLIRDDAFNGGMLMRAPSILGDKTDPTTWRAGNKTNPVDVFLIVAANDEAAVATRSNELIVAATGAGMTVSWRETARRLDDDSEHFGFRDGISQPSVIGFDSEGTHGAGFFIFGYPKSPGGEPYSPVVDDRKVTDNGSLLVWRRLRQDVTSFRAFCAHAAEMATVNWPTLTGDHLAALLVGRWPSGTPVKAGVSADPAISPPDNSFDFSDDLDAKSCPFGAHIRKVNPRAGPKDVVDIPRMIRRGIPFGRRYDEAPDELERGLIFLAFQSSIKGQFEFLTQHWMNSALKPARGDDLLVGRGDTLRSMAILGPNGPINIPAPAHPWITPSGGAYLFAPSRAGLKKLADPPAPLGLWKAKQLIYMATDRIKAIFE